MLTGLLIFGALGMARPGYAQFQENGAILSQMLPEHTLAVAVFPNLEYTAQRLSQIPLVAQIMTTQPEPLWSFLRPGSGNLAERFTQSTHGISLAELGAIFHRSVAVALLDQNSATFIDNPGTVPFVFLADVTDTAEALQRLLETRLIPAIQAQEESVELGIESFAGTAIYRIANQQFQVYYTFFQHLFILTFQHDTLHELLLTRQDVLTASAHRMALERYLQEPQDAWVYINLRRLQQRLHALIPQACPAYAPLFQAFLAQFDWETLLWTVAYCEHGGSERLFLGMKPGLNDRAEQGPSLTTGLWRTGNGSFASSRLIPASAMYYGAQRVNFPELWQHIVHVSQRDPELPQQDRLTPHIQTIETVLQLDIETDILPVLGQEAAIIWFPEFSQKPTSKHQSDAAIPLVWLIHISDQQRFDVVWSKIRTALQMQPVNTFTQGIPVETIALTGQLVPLTLYTARIADFLAISLSADGVQEILQGLQQRAPLIAQEGYRQIAALFPGQGYATGYVNLALLAKGVRQLLEHRAAATLRPDQIALAALANELIGGDERPGLAWMTTVIEAGFLTESFSPVGGTVISALIAWMGWNVLQ